MDGIRKPSHQKQERIMYAMTKDYCKKVGEWYIDRRRGVSKEIRPFDDDEKKRSKERDRLNEKNIIHIRFGIVSIMCCTKKMLCSR